MEEDLQLEEDSLVKEVMRPKLLVQVFLEVVDLNLHLLVGLLVHRSRPRVLLELEPRQSQVVQEDYLLEVGQQEVVQQLAELAFLAKEVQAAHLEELQSKEEGVLPDFLEDRLSQQHSLLHQEISLVEVVLVPNHKTRNQQEIFSVEHLKLNLKPKV